MTFERTKYIKIKPFASEELIEGTPLDKMQVEIIAYGFRFAIKRLNVEFFYPGIRLVRQKGLPRSIAGDLNEMEETTKTVFGHKISNDYWFSTIYIPYIAFIKMRYWKKP